MYLLTLKIFRFFFWLGYALVFIVAFIPVKGRLSKTKIGPELFQIRLDYLIHFAVYLGICMYYLFLQKNGVALFKGNSMKKFVILTLILASFTEVIQLLIPYRSFNIFDLMSNLLGLITGLLILKYLLNNFR
jgi:VanZ family protein